MQPGSYFPCVPYVWHTLCASLGCGVLSAAPRLQKGRSKGHPCPNHPHGDPLKMPHLFWPRTPAWSREWFQRGLEHADNPERKTRVPRTRCPGLPHQPSWCSPGPRPPAAASLGSPGGPWPCWLGRQKTARTKLGCSCSFGPWFLPLHLPQGFGHWLLLMRTSGRERRWRQRSSARSCCMGCCKERSSRSASRCLSSLVL